MEVIEINKIAECTFWAVECPKCKEMIEINETPKKDMQVECDNCDAEYVIG